MREDKLSFVILNQRTTYKKETQLEFAGNCVVFSARISHYSKEVVLYKI